MSLEQVSQRLDRRRHTQRMRRLRKRSEQVDIQSPSTGVQKRHTCHNYAAQRRTSLSTEQRDQQLAMRRSNYKQIHLTGIKYLFETSK